METEVAGEEDACGNTNDAAATEEKLAPMILPARRPPRLPPQKLARGRAIALTALRPQERQALHRPPIPPPLLWSQAPKSLSPAPT